MIYKILHTDTFIKWFENINDIKSSQRISNRIDRLRNGNIGDAKTIDKNLYELRFFFGSGYRIYFTKKANTIIILLCGGDKSTQSKDIKKAKEILKEI